MYPAGGHHHDDHDHGDPTVHRLTKTPQERDLEPLERLVQRAIARPPDDSTTTGMSAARGHAGHQTPDEAVQRDQGPGLVVIGNLPLLRPSRRIDNRVQEVSEISRDLKELAKELHVPVIALSQLNREVEHRHPPVPVLPDLRDGGSLEQDADLVLFIYRGDIYERDKGGTAQLIIAKQRNGPIGDVPLTFQSHWVRFEALANDHGARMWGERP